MCFGEISLNCRDDRYCCRIKGGCRDKFFAPEIIDLKRFLITYLQNINEIHRRKRVKI